MGAIGMMCCKQSWGKATTRRGAAIPLVVVSSTVLIGMAALAIDTGLLYRARAELQRTADSAALAAASQMLDEDRLKGLANLNDNMSAGREQAIALASRNKVMGVNPALDPNVDNEITGDIVFGYLSNPNNLQEQLSFSQTNRYNTVTVRVRRNQIRNGPINLYFANIFGISSANLGAEATATLKDGAIGFRTPKTGTECSLLPLALKKDAWDALLAGTLTHGDNYTYDSETKTVTSGGDGIQELNLYPGSASGATQLGPGNFGTVDIGSDNNSTADLSRQIRYGPNAADLAYYGGELKLSSNGTLLLNGDTGLSAGIKDDLESIIGKPRVIPLFNAYNGNGNNSVFTIVGFAGIRIVYVKLTGSMSSKKVMIQPAFVVDSSVITTSGSGNSSFVYEPVRLVR